MIGFLWNLSQQTRIRRLERRVAELEGRRKPALPPKPPTIGQRLAVLLFLIALAILIAIAALHA